MVWFDLHGATEAIEGDHDQSIGYKGGHPSLDWKGEAKLLEGVVQMLMSDIVEETLNVTGKY